jgi:hypothetical protein
VSKRALGVGENLARFLQEPDAIHLRHALIDEQQGHTIIAHLQLAQNVERPHRGIASDDAVVPHRIACANRARSPATHRYRRQHSTGSVLP